MATPNDVKRGGMEAAADLLNVLGSYVRRIMSYSALTGWGARAGFRLDLANVLAYKVTRGGRRAWRCSPGSRRSAEAMTI